MGHRHNPYSVNIIGHHDVTVLGGKSVNHDHDVSKRPGQQLEVIYANITAQAKHCHSPQGTCRQNLLRTRHLSRICSKHKLFGEIKRNRVPKIKWSSTAYPGPPLSRLPLLQPLSPHCSACLSTRSPRDPSLRGFSCRHTQQ